ncbi:unnamed protein product [Timema podura]|uniref:Uncharacterized protein n=1 Tax=Timema podura TaxID=61482 RepID=A0ABN7PE84_TIMPD|nr:unnamed protein product [Timema podura]
MDMFIGKRSRAHPVVSSIKSHRASVRVNVPEHIQWSRVLRVIVPLSELVELKHLCVGRVENSFVKTTLRTPDRDSNLILPFIGGLVYCESSSLDHASTE